MTLIERLEAATGPDRELDAAVFHAIGAPLPQQAFGYDLKMQRDPGRAESYIMPIGGMSVRYEAPAYTASIDAALTLVPEGHRKAMHLTWHRCVLPGAMGYGATPALAICIAALKAQGE